MNTTTLTFAAALLTTLACQAQEERQGPPQGGRPQHPPMALMQALDTDRDHKISADEIEGSTAALKKLDENGDGEITREELKPKPPEGAPEGEQPAGPPPGQAGPPPEEGDNQAQRPSPPVPPLFATLDADRDGKISSTELEAAPEGLAKLDKNEDGEVTPRELRPQGPPRGQGQQQRPRKD
jgi:hypothetical protein